MKAITLIATIIDHFNQGHLIKQGSCWMLYLWTMLTLSISLSSHISHDNRVSYRLMTGHHYKSRAETQISFLIRGSTRALINQETKVGISIEIHSRSPSLLSRPITLTIKKIRLQMIKRTISSTRIYSIITYLRKTFKSMRHLQKTFTSRITLRSIRTTQSKLTLLYLSSQLQYSHVEFIRISLSLATSFINISLLSV